MIESTKRNKQITGNAGLYYCCYRLSDMGFNVMATSRNARGVDIIIYDEGAKNYCGIQVKTLSERNAVPLGKSLDTIMGDFWIIVVLKPLKSYIMTPKEVRSGAYDGKKDGKECWLEKKHFELPDFEEKWNRIGLGKGQAQ